MFVHQNLKILRKRKGMTQQEVSTAIDINRSSLAGYESQIQPDLGLLIKFSEFFNVTIDTMVKVDLAKLSERQLPIICRNWHKLRMENSFLKFKPN